MRRRFWPSPAHSPYDKNAPDNISSSRAEIIALSTHPGFICLSAQLALHEAREERKLKLARTTPAKTMDEVISRAIEDAHTSEAIFRLGWMRHIVLNEIFKDKAAKATAKAQAQPAYQVPEPLAQ